MSLSLGEKVFIHDSIKADIRMDGRQRSQFRSFQLSLDEIPTASGSARLQMNDTNVLAVVKAQVGAPDPAEENMGQFNISVDCARNLCVQWDASEAQSMSAELTATMRRVFLDSGVLRRDLLCLIPGRACWILNIDVTVHSSSGNLVDAIALAIKAALRATMVPAVTVVKRGAESGKQQEWELEVESSASAVVPLGAWDALIPLTCTVGRVGEHLVLDASFEEESCVSSSLQMIISPQGRILGLRKAGLGGFSPALMTEALQMVNYVGGQLVKQFEAAFMAAVRGDEELESDLQAEDISDE
jgi:exosome complex component RRP42